jgi:RecA-family ATPase
MASYFGAIEPGRFGLVIADAFYRFLPAGTDENSNADLAGIYNCLDGYANRLGCSFVLIHHASKGSQTGKSVTDVGAGAGSQARATDTHLVLRQHEETDCAVLEAAVRSFPPIQPRVLRWTFPVWTPEDSLDPAALKPERPRRKPKQE